MSKLILISIRDNVAEIFNKPASDLNIASAMRSFKLSLQNEPQKQDYTLYKIGTLDQITGQITPEIEPIQLMTGFEVENDMDSEKPNQFVNKPVHLQDQAI